MTTHKMKRIKGKMTLLCKQDKLYDSEYSAMTSLTDIEAKLSDTERKLEVAVKALARLRNETKGLLGVSEYAIRRDAGNTNYECVKLAVNQAEEALQEIKGEVK